MGNAAYAVGTVLAVQFAQHLPQRRMLLGYAVVLVVGSVLAAAAQNPGMFVGGHVLQGLATSMLLIAAAPPLTIGFPRDKLRNTAVIMNMCVFGAVALGPFIGGVQAEAHAWRPLFWIVAAIAVLALIMAALTFEDAPPADLDAPRDLKAIALAAVGCTAAFVGAAQLTTHAFSDLAASVPMFGGLALIVVLIVYQFRAQRPLLTVRTMMTSAIPVAGVGVALFAAAASVAATALTANVLLQGFSPVQVGLLYLPEVGGAIVMAVVFGFVITRKAMHYLPLVGMALLAAGIVVFGFALPGNVPLILVGSGLTGLALGATVAPALFVAGFSLQSASLQRVFAIIELLRAVAAFMVAPILAHVAIALPGDLNAGTGVTLWIGFGLAIGGAVFGVAIYALSGARPQKPDLDEFLDGESPAWYSPPLLARLRSGLPSPVAVPERAEPTHGAVGSRRPPSDRWCSHTTEQTWRRTQFNKQRANSGPGDARWWYAYGSRRTSVSRRPMDEHFDADQAREVRRAAERTAAHGRRWRKQAGFRAQSIGGRGRADVEGHRPGGRRHDASLIVLGPHRRSGLLGHLQGSVAAAVIAHSTTPVLVIPERRNGRGAHVETQTAAAVSNKVAD